MGLGYGHLTVNHGEGEYARGEIHCNTIEGIWSIVRQWLRAHRGVSKKWLKYYVAIIEFFYNLKHAPGSSLAVLFQAIC
jgi:transposase